MGNKEKVPRLALPTKFPPSYVQGVQKKRAPRKDVATVKFITSRAYLTGTAIVTAFAKEIKSTRNANAVLPVEVYTANKPIMARLANHPVFGWSLTSLNANFLRAFGGALTSGQHVKVARWDGRVIVEKDIPTAMQDDEDEVIPATVNTCQPKSKAPTTTNVPSSPAAIPLAFTPRGLPVRGMRPNPAAVQPLGLEMPLATQKPAASISRVAPASSGSGPMSMPRPAFLTPRAMPNETAAAHFPPYRSTACVHTQAPASALVHSLLTPRLRQIPLVEAMVPVRAIPSEENALAQAEGHNRSSGAILSSSGTNTCSASASVTDIDSIFSSLSVRTSVATSEDGDIVCMSSPPAPDGVNTAKVASMTLDVAVMGSIGPRHGMYNDGPGAAKITNGAPDFAALDMPSPGNVAKGVVLLNGWRTPRGNIRYGDAGPFG